MLDKTKNYKIDVSALTTVERTALQEQLFLLGYSWYESGQEVTDLDSDTLFLDRDQEITCGNKDDFRHWDYPILTVSDIMPQPITPATLSLRDYFAGQALFGLMAMYPLSDVQVAKRAYQYADAMLKERNK